MSTTLPPLVEATAEDLGHAYRQLQRTLLQFLPLGGLFVVASLVPESFTRAMALGLVLLVFWAVLRGWDLASHDELPHLPVYVLMQVLMLALPIYKDSEGLLTPLDQIFPAGLNIACWLGGLFVGWKLCPESWGVLPPAPRLPVRLARIPVLPHLLLAAGLAIELFIRSDLYWQLLGSGGTSLLSPIRTGALMLELVGGFLGALEFGLGRLPSDLVWWALWLGVVINSLYSLLLSASQSLLMATLFGVWLTSIRRAIPVTLALLFLFSVLHAGKYAMRHKHWEEGQQMPSNPIELVDGWLEASRRAAKKPSKDQHSAEARFNLTQNVLFVQTALAEGYQPMLGGSYAVVPEVLVPRIFSSEKVRSQEGQVLLNLHFGRQQTREETETTYIAWGMLAEAIGNFDNLLGPLLMGGVYGVLVRMSANLARFQYLFSTPGVISMILMMLWVVSSEFVASTFAASAFQWVMMLLGLMWVIRRLIPDGGQSSEFS